jgi:arylsulfatase A-like enzyme
MEVRESSDVHVLCLRLLALALALPLPLPGLADADPEREKPNVVFILADDLGFTDLPAYRRPLGLSLPVETPNLDRLAAEGMLFLDAHQSASVCAPARFATVTGSHHLRGRAAWGMKAASPFDHGRPHRHRTVGEILQAAGYRTAFVGKEHLGGRGLDAEGMLTGEAESLDFGKALETTVTRGDGTQQTRPLGRPHGLVAHGFDYTCTLASGLSAPPYVYWENDRFRPIDGGPADDTRIRTWHAHERTDRGNGDAVIPVAGRGDVGWDPVMSGPRLARAATDFIGSHVREHPGVPFLLFYASPAVHPTSAPPLDFDGDPSTLDEPIRGTTPARRSDLVVQFDHEVGRILDALASHGIAGDTLVFVSSDNGGLASLPPEIEMGYGANESLRGHKGSPFEGGHRVPLIVRWGDGTREGSRIPPGVTTQQLVAVTDWVASLYDLTGQTMERDQVYDGASLLPLLFSEDPDAEPTIRRYHLVAQRGIGVRFDEPDVEAARTRRWFYFQGSDEHFAGHRYLFDLDDDPAQQHNLLAGLPRIPDTAGLPGLVYHRYLALLPRVVGLGNWLRAHRGPDDLPTTRRVDYSRPENRTPIPPPR